MRRALRAICIATAAILLLTTLFGGSLNYDGWKEVEIPGYGTMEMPVNWKVCRKDGNLYLTDKPLDEPDCHIYFFQLLDCDEDMVVCGKTIRFVEWGSGVAFSNSARVFADKFNVDGVTQTLAGFSICGILDDELPTLEFYTFDADISEKTIRRIAKSFSMFVGE